MNNQSANDILDYFVLSSVNNEIERYMVYRLHCPRIRQLRWANFEGQPYRIKKPSCIDYFHNFYSVIDPYRSTLIGFHPPNAPTQIIFNYGIKRETWYRNGKVSRNDGPSIIESYSTGRREQWYKNGVRYRDNDNPDCVVYTDENQIHSVYWSKRHNNITLDGLVYIETTANNMRKFQYNKDGIINTEEMSNKSLEEIWKLYS